MFSLTVIDTDAFQDMPLSTQALYFHLCMRADDDGFVGSPKTIVRTIGASEDDFKLLIAKRFILLFEDGVIVIKHWRMHNTLSVDRYKETTYTENKAMLKMKTNKAYTLNDGLPIDDTRLIDMGKRQTNKRRTKDEQKTNTDKNSIDKDSIEKVSKDNKSARFIPPTFEEVQVYCFERGNNVDARKFMNHYESNGWMVGRTKMKDWKAAVRTWESNEYDKPKKNDDFVDVVNNFLNEK